MSDISASPRSARRRCAAPPRSIADLQIEYSLISRGIEDRILPACRALGIGVTAYGVLSRGLISGHWTPERRPGSDDGRHRMPRFAPANLAHNLALVETLRGIAAARGLSVAQLAIAWVAAQGPDIVPLIGPRRPDRLAKALGALAVTLSPEDLAQIAAALPPGAAAGERCPPALMAHLDSEAPAPWRSATRRMPAPPALGP